MFNEEILNYILHDREETYLEYKDSMNWKHDGARSKIICAMLAVSNHRDGGVVVIGVKEEKFNKSFCPLGMNDDDFNSFNYDDVARIIREYSDPLIEFKLLADTAKIDEQNRKFVVIQVAESKEPTICIGYRLWNKTAGYFTKNIALRKNAIYIRSKAPIESREIATIHEWRDLIDRAIEKNKKELFRKLPCLSFIKKEDISDISDIKKHNQDLTDDNL